MLFLVALVGEPKCGSEKQRIRSLTLPPFSRMQGQKQSHARNQGKPFLGIGMFIRRKEEEEDAQRLWMVGVICWWSMFVFC
jgi:hypothetical protein